MYIIDSELSKHDAICFSETHFNASIDNGQMQLSGVQGPFRVDRNRHGGRVAVFAKTNLNVNVRDFLYSPLLELLLWV